MSCLVVFTKCYWTRVRNCTAGQQQINHVVLPFQQPRGRFKYNPTRWSNDLAIRRDHIGHRRIRVDHLLLSVNCILFRLLLLLYLMMGLLAEMAVEVIRPWAAVDPVEAVGKVVGPADAEDFVVFANQVGNLEGLKIGERKWDREKMSC